MPQITLFVADPAHLRARWAEWVLAGAAAPAAPRLTVVESAPAGARLVTTLRARRTPSAGVRILTHSAAARLAFPTAPAAPASLAIAIMAPLLEASLPPRSAFRGRPGATASLLAAARVLRRCRTSVDRLARLSDEDLAAALRLAHALWDRAAGAGFDDGTLLDRAGSAPAPWVPTLPVAVYDPSLASDGGRWLWPWLSDRPAAVFLARPAADDSEGQALLAWWRSRAGMVAAEDTDDAPPRQPMRLAPADAADRVVAVATVLAGAEGLVVTDPEDVAGLARALQGRGVAAAPHPMPERPGPWRAAWDASTPAPAAAPLLEWARSRFPTPVLVDLHDSWDRPGRWPDPVRVAHSAMTRARAALLLSSTWQEAASHLSAWIEAAGLAPVTFSDPARWDALGFGTSRDALEAWVRWSVEGGLDDDGWSMRDAEVWVTDAEHAAGIAADAVVWMGGEIRVPDPPADAVPSLLTDFVRHALGLSDSVDRLRRARAVWQRHLAGARRVVVVSDPGAATGEWTAFARERRRGDGVAAGLGRASVEFGAFDGWFLPHHVPPPRSASGFERFGRCPLQYAWRALDVTPPPEASAGPDARVLGLWAHRVLADAAGATPPPSVSEVRERLAEAVRDEPPSAGVVAGVLEGTLDTLAMDLARVLQEAPRGELYTEHRWQWSWRGRDLTGVMDRVEKRPDGSILVVDYKSGIVPPAVVDPMHLQLALYAKAASEVFDVPLDRVSAAYWGIRSENKFARRDLLPPTSARWAEADRIMAGIVERVEAGTLYMAPQPAACRTCDWRAACPPGSEALGQRKAGADPGFGALWATGGEQARDAAD